MLPWSPGSIGPGYLLPKTPPRLDASPEAITQERDDTVRRLLEANQRFYEAFEALDLEMMDGVWAHNPVVTCMHPSPGWALLKGWEAVRQSWEVIFGRLRSIRFELSELRVVLAGDLAWILLVERLSAYGYDSDEEIREATVATNLFERAGSSYRMLHHQATLLITELEEQKPGDTVSETLPNLFDESDEPDAGLSDEPSLGEGWGGATSPKIPSPEAPADTPDPPTKAWRR
jgi:ketosteroid isomerase-like protein